MPTFDGVEITVTADVDFEIFCGQCGAGICSNGNTRKSRSRSMPQVVIEPCEKCLEKAAGKAADEREREIRDELEPEIAYLKDELRRLQCIST